MFYVIIDNMNHFIIIACLILIFYRQD